MTVFTWRMQSYKVLVSLPPLRADTASPPTVRQSGACTRPSSFSACMHSSDRTGSSAILQQNQSPGKIKCWAFPEIRTNLK